MEIAHAHNLIKPRRKEPRPFGIHIRLPVGDSFVGVLGPDWETFHWYVTEVERDAALEEMSKQHLYSRSGDQPSLIFDKIGRDPS